MFLVKGEREGGGGAHEVIVLPIEGDKNDAGHIYSVKIQPSYIHQEDMLRYSFVVVCFCLFFVCLVCCLSLIHI